MSNTHSICKLRADRYITLSLTIHRLNLGIRKLVLDPVEFDTVYSGATGKPYGYDTVPKVLTVNGIILERGE